VRRIGEGGGRETGLTGSKKKKSFGTDRKRLSGFCSISLN
jgi:hypothetical protein